MVLKVDKIAIDSFDNRGKWNQKAIMDFLKSNFKSNTAIAVDLNEFYKTFYNGSHVIRHQSFYCRKHIVDGLNELKISGIAAVDNKTLKIRFD